MFRLLFIAFLGEYRGELDTDRLHASSWVMNVPVAILVVPTVAIGGAIMSGAGSPWERFFSPLFGPQMAPVPSLGPPAISEGITSGIVFALVIAGFAIAWWRYACADAQRDAVARLERETQRMPGVLVRLYYVDDAIALLFIRPAQRLGAFFGSLFDPHIVDGAVRDVVFWASWLGTLVRSLQTGFVRAYALILVFGAACFIVYYAFAAGALR
jgi:NADH-quinone oxidoreductase subunit L